jgi:hypothetical protein
MHSGLLGTAMRAPASFALLLVGCTSKDVSYLSRNQNYYALAISVIAPRKVDDITGRATVRLVTQPSGNADYRLTTACRISSERAVEVAMVKSVGTAVLSSFLSKHILQICHNKYNPKNNCAHFVGHALGIKVGDTNCFNVAPAGQPKPGSGFHHPGGRPFQPLVPRQGPVVEQASSGSGLFVLHFNSEQCIRSSALDGERRHETCGNLCRRGGLALLQLDAESGHDDRGTDA